MFPEQWQHLTGTRQKPLKSLFIYFGGVFTTPQILKSAWRFATFAPDKKTLFILFKPEGKILIHATLN